MGIPAEFGNVSEIVTSHRKSILRLTCILVCLAFAFPLKAQQYSFRHYGAAEGLQNMTILSFAQDRDGYIWAGSEAGLYRYDGTRFRLMGEAEGLPCGTEIHTLYVAADGALWTNACNQIFRFDGQVFHSVPGLNSPLQGSQRIAEDAACLSGCFSKPQYVVVSPGWVAWNGPFSSHLLIGGGLVLGSESQQGLESRHRLLAPIMTKDEFIKVSLEPMAAHAVMGSEQPLLQVADGPVGQRHRGLRAFVQVRSRRLRARHMAESRFLQSTEAPEAVLR